MTDLRFDPHIVCGKPWEPSYNKSFYRWLAPLVQAHGCVRHGEDCPLKEVKDD